jgi:hypothetical protein
LTNSHSIREVVLFPLLRAESAVADASPEAGPLQHGMSPAPPDKHSK